MCHTLGWMLHREPVQASRFSWYVDKWHHKGHAACSPYMSNARDPLSSYLNSSVMEQGNR